MTETSPALDEWRNLYQAAISFQETAPWEWMGETDIFGVRNPETDDLGFASIMGALGEHCALAVYLGPKGLFGFWNFQEADREASYEMLLEIPHLQSAFTSRNELTQKDRNVIKELGLKFRGQNAWPRFRSYRPGFVPWYLEAQEARFLTHALKQAVDVSLRVREEPSLLAPADEESYLVRVPRKEGDALIWEDQILGVPPFVPPSIRISMDVQLLEALKRAPRSRRPLEMDFFLLPASIQEKGGRPYYPYVLVVVDAQSGMIFDSEMLSPEPSLESMWGQVPLNVVHQLARVGSVPNQIRIRSSLLAQLLQPLSEELGFDLRRSARLPALDEAKQFMLQRFT